MKNKTGNDDSKKEYSRRKFINTLGATAAGLLAAPYIKSENIFAYGIDKNASFLTKVAVTQATSYDRTLIKQKVQHLFESIGGIGDIVSAGKNVGIKVNLTGGSTDTNHVCTNPEVLRAVTELIIDCGVNKSNIYMVEALWGALPSNYTTIINNLGITVVDLNKVNPYSSFITRNVGNNYFNYPSYTMNQILADVDVYVSIPKLKQHYEAGFTGSLKNQIGTVPIQFYTTPGNTGRRDALHTKDGTVSSKTQLPRSICDLNLARPVHLAVIDGVMNAHGSEGTWNPTYVATADNILIAGKDPVATDSIAAHFLGNNPELSQFKLPAMAGQDRGYCDNHLYMLHQLGIGTNQLNEIEVVGDGASLVSVPSQHVSVNPDGYQLNQNYPNPFNPSTSIKYYVPQSGYLTITIYNVMGQKIETLIDASISAGTHEVHWVPKNLASGVYLCTMRIGNFSETTKLIYQK
jgi:uncharacterized protein (DUF362 family)